MGPAGEVLKALGFKNTGRIKTDPVGACALIISIVLICGCEPRQVSYPENPLCFHDKSDRLIRGPILLFPSYCIMGPKPVIFFISDPIVYEPGDPVRNVWQPGLASLRKVASVPNTAEGVEFRGFTAVSPLGQTAWVDWMIPLVGTLPYHEQLSACRFVSMCEPGSVLDLVKILTEISQGKEASVRLGLGLSRRDAHNVLMGELVLPDERREAFPVGVMGSEVYIVIENGMGTIKLAGSLAQELRRIHKLNSGP